MVGSGVEVKGLDELKRKFAEIPLKLRKKYLRLWLSAGGRLIRDTAKGGAPKLQRPAKYRTAGTLKKAISLRTSKRDRKDGNVGVFVNVKPLKGGSAKNPRDPFYWRWQEFGWNPARKGESKRERRTLNKRGDTKRQPGREFLKNSTKKLPEALKKFEEAAAKWFSKINASGKVE